MVSKSYICIYEKEVFIALTLTLGLLFKDDWRELTLSFTEFPVKVRFGDRSPEVFWFKWKFCWQITKLPVGKVINVITLLIT